MTAEPRPSGYMTTLEHHQEVLAGVEAAHRRQTDAILASLGQIKDKVRELVAVRLAKPGTDDEQRVWDELMELVNDG